MVNRKRVVEEHNYSEVEREASTGSEREQKAMNDQNSGQAELNQHNGYEVGQSSGQEKINMQSFTQQMAQAMADPNAEGSSELITMIRRVVMVGKPQPPIQPQGPTRFEAVTTSPTQVFQNPIFDNPFPTVSNDRNDNLPNTVNETIPIFQAIPMNPRNPPMMQNYARGPNMVEPPIIPVPVPNQVQMPNQEGLRAQLVDIIQDMYGPGLRRPERPIFRSPFPVWINEMALPRNVRVPNLTLYSGEENQSILEHMGRFTLQIGDLGINQFYKMKMFPSSLTRNVFTWFINLPHNSVTTWQELEEQFHAQFFRTEPEVSMADLAKLKQEPNETAEQFLARFKKVRYRCHVHMPET